MRIRTLELHGFKSFPDRTVLQFDPGISCIVGPNGCGKSNIVDALRWCIGEQSARSLRGGEMLDVIFAGSQERKPVGFAEVVMTLTTDGGEPFPGEFAQLTEVSVGRRLHRSGQSEYLINQRRVRRRDVVDLFLDTGVGNNLYSFIEQGRIGKIVHARPEERRSLVDEAAGISRYKARRDEAQRRLEATAAQLDRAADVAEEMGRRVRSLARQVRKAARFRRLRAEIRQEEVVLAMARYNALAQDRRALRAQLRTAEGELNTARRGRARREQDLAERREELSVVEAGVDTWRDEVAEHDARTRELAGSIGFAERRIEELGARREAATQAGADAAAEAEDARKSRSEQEATRSEAEVEAASAAERLSSARAASERGAVEILEVREATRALRDAAGEARTEVVATAREVERLQAEVEAWPGRLEVASLALTEAGKDVEAAQTALDAATDRAARASGDGDRAGALRDEAAAQVEAAERAVAEAERALEARQAEVQQTEDALRAEGRRLEAKVGTAREQVDAARAAVAERVSQAQAQADEAARKARAAQRDRAQAQTRGAQARAQQWIDALLARRGQAEAEARRAASEAERGARRELQERQDRLESEVAERLQAALTQARQASAAELQQLDEAASSAEDALAAASRSLEDARLSARDAEIRRTTTEARLAAIEAAIAENLASDAGSAAIREAFPDLRPLAEHLDLSARQDEALLRQLGFRLLLPVVHEPAQVEAIAELIGPDGHARVLLRPAGPLSAAEALGGVRVAAGLADALASGAAVCADGSRVDADGVVHLGVPDASGARLARAAGERDALVDQLEKDTVDLASARARVQQAEAERDDADLALAEAREQASRLGARLEQRLSELRERSRRDEDADRLALREAADAADAARMHALHTQLEALATGAETAVKTAREVRDRTLAALDASHSAELASLDAELAERRGALVEAAREAAASELDQAVAALEAARIELETHRSSERARRDAARAPLQGLRDALNTVRSELDEKRRALAQADQRRSDTALFATRAESAAAAATAALTRAEQALTAATRSEASARADAARTTTALAAAEQALADAEARAAQARGLADEAGERLQSAEEAREAQAAALSEAEVQAATWAERARAAAQALEATIARQSAIQARIDASAAEAAEAAEGIEESRAALQTATSEREQVDLARAEAWERLERERARLHELRAAVAEGEQDLKRLTEAELEATRSVEALGAQLSSTRDDIDALRGRMEERYQLSIPGLLDQLDARGDLVLEPDAAVSQDFEIDGNVVPALLPMVVTSGDLVDQEALAERVEALAEARRQLERIGDVNLAAIDEWADVRDRHADLEAQRSDLEASVSRIRAAIAKMNRTCRQRFRDTFELVNQHFQEMYPRLVGGGSARLSLTDEEDLLETGVDIFVQPPGKRLQNLTLLSGGEKAMTAIALILSLFKVKPSPFCVLDEVDAPLDEANGSRFNEALREMAQHSQFIVVTHNRKTMECAATLYGITMPQPGCSRLVSVQL